MRGHDSTEVGGWVADAKRRALELGPGELSRTLFEFVHVFCVPHRRATELSDALRALGYETTHTRSIRATTVYAATRGVRTGSGSSAQDTSSNG